VGGRTRVFRAVQRGRYGMLAADPYLKVKDEVERSLASCKELHGVWVAMRDRKLTKQEEAQFVIHHQQLMSSLSSVDMDLNDLDETINIVTENRAKFDFDDSEVEARRAFIEDCRKQAKQLRSEAEAEDDDDNGPGLSKRKPFKNKASYAKVVATGPDKTDPALRRRRIRRGLCVAVLLVLALAALVYAISGEVLGFALMSIAILPAVLIPTMLLLLRDPAPPPALLAQSSSADGDELTQAMAATPTTPTSSRRWGGKQGKKLGGKNPDERAGMLQADDELESGAANDDGDAPDDDVSADHWCLPLDEPHGLRCHRALAARLANATPVDDVTPDLLQSAFGSRIGSSFTAYDSVGVEEYLVSRRVPWPSRKIMLRMLASDLLSFERLEERTLTLSRAKAHRQQVFEPAHVASDLAPSLSLEGCWGRPLTHSVSSRSETRSSVFFSNGSWASISCSFGDSDAKAQGRPTFKTVVVFKLDEMNMTVTYHNLLPPDEGPPQMAVATVEYRQN